MASDITTIRTKVRRLTRTPSAAQLTDADINEYVNTFYQYDLPEELRLFTLKQTLTFYTQPNKDTYTTGDANVPGLSDFKNEYITVSAPFYIAGNLAYFSQNREEFFNYWPINSFRETVATGDAVTVIFTGTLSQLPLIQNSLSFSSVNAANVGLIVEDSVIDNQTGNLVVPGTTVSVGTINYITGVYSVTFGSAPASNEIIQAQYRPYVAALPTAVLYYDNTFTLRPVPDRPYKVVCDAYIKPIAFLSQDNNTTPTEPELDQWWQYLAYGAAKKVFEDRADLDSVQQIMPEFERQQRLLLRRTLVQRSTQQAATIYNNTSSSWWGYNGYWGNYSI
jgi:hypothetical protein